MSERSTDPVFFGVACGVLFGIGVMFGLFIRATSSTAAMAVEKPKDELQHVDYMIGNTWYRVMTLPTGERLFETYHGVAQVQPVPK